MGSEDWGMQNSMHKIWNLIIRTVGRGSFGHHIFKSKIYTTTEFVCRNQRISKMKNYAHIRLFAIAKNILTMLFRKDALSASHITM